MTAMIPAGSQPDAELQRRAFLSKVYTNLVSVYMWPPENTRTMLDEPMILEGIQAYRDRGMGPLEIAEALNKDEHPTEWVPRVRETEEPT
jgi:hypothetical protein